MPASDTNPSSETVVGQARDLAVSLGLAFLVVAILYWALD